MGKLHRFAKYFARVVDVVRDNRAATAVEYGLIVALIVIAMIASFQGVANSTVGMWGNVHTRMANATGY